MSTLREFENFHPLIEVRLVSLLVLFNGSE
jgi:hypothetical protein